MSDGEHVERPVVGRVVGLSDMVEVIDGAVRCPGIKRERRRVESFGSVRRLRGGWRGADARRG